MALAGFDSIVWVVVVFFVVRLLFYLIKKSNQARKQYPEPQWFEERPPTADSAPVSKGWVLVVDDSKTIRTAVRMLLQPEGYGVLEAETGSEAWKLVRDERPGLVLADVKLRALNGYQLAEKILLDSRTSEIPVIFLSATPENEQRSLPPNVHQMLRKPFESDQLMKAVEQSISSVDFISVCPVCDTTVEGESTTCPNCGAIHHPECFILNDGCGKCGFKTSS